MPGSSPFQWTCNILVCFVNCLSSRFYFLITKLVNKMLLKYSNIQTKLRIHYDTAKCNLDGFFVLYKHHMCTLIHSKQPKTSLCLHVTLCDKHCIEHKLQTHKNVLTPEKFTQLQCLLTVLSVCLCFGHNWSSPLQVPL